MEAFEPYERRDWPAAIATAEAALARFPDDPLLLYNLACCESLGGRREAALVHLREALAGDPSLLETARADSDFAALADETAFRELVG
jgi:tetratricopeptide (TPR) repeat protein